MERPIVVAQAGSQATPGAPAKVVTVNKPFDSQAVTIHLEGPTTLNLASIANEQITLVHLGDRLIILFDNHAQVTLEPFYGDNGQPLADLTVELAQGRDVTGADFAGLFPISADQSALPAAGDAGSPSSGANFNGYSIDPLTLPSPLPLLGPEDFGGTFTADDGAPLHNTPGSVLSLTGGTLSGDTFEGGLLTDTILTVGNHPGEPTIVSGPAGSLNGLVDFGAAGPGATPFQFVNVAAAETYLSSLGLTSQGMSVDHVTIVGNTLTVGTDPAQTGQPTNDPNPHDVFSITIGADGSITFTLLGPLDDANPGHLTPGPAVLDQIALDLSGFIQAVDALGNTLTLSHDVIVNVHDDAPVLITSVPSESPDGPSFDNTVSAEVDETALAGPASPGDMFGNGNGGGTATVTGNLNTLVAFGADGPDFDLVHQVYDGFQLVSQSNATTWLASLNLTSHDQAVDFASVSGNTLTAWTGGGPGDPNAHEVFSLTINGDGSYSFTIINPLDHPEPGHATPAPEVVDSLTLDLSGFVQAVDFDGDSITLSGDFKIDVVDDVPVLPGGGDDGSGTFIVESVDEGGLTSGTPGDLFGSGNDPGFAVSASGNLSDLGVQFGADGPDVVDGNAAAYRIAVANNSTLDFGVTSHGVEVDFVTVTDGPAGSHGTSQTLTAWTDGGPDGGGHEVFTLTINGDGTFTFSLINPIDHPIANSEDVLQLDLSGIVEAVDFDGDALILPSGTFVVDVTDDVPVAASGTSSGSVDEGGLRFGFPILTAGDFFGNGNDHGATTTSGSLAGLVSFGADGPQSGTVHIHNGTVTIADGFQLVSESSAASWLASLNLTSHGQAINFADVDTHVSSTGTETETLTAWTNGGPLHLGHEVFTLTLDVSTGAWTFHLVNPIDDMSGDGTSATIDLSGLVQAIDFDGDSVVLSGDVKVTVVDDSPVLTSGSILRTVDEGGLRDSAHGGTDSFGNGNDHGLTIAVGGGLLSGSLNNLVSFGADGPALSNLGSVPVIANGFQFAVADGTTHDFGVESHGVEVNYITLSSQTVTLDGESQTLTAYAGQGGPAVFTLTLNGDGSWLFHLLEPLDDTTAPGTSFTLDLSSLIKAVDFDGDSVTLSNDFKIKVLDDVPVAASGTSSGAVDEGGLTFSATGGDLFGDGNDHGAATSATVSLSGLVSFGADGPGVPAFQFVDQTIANNFLTGLNLSSHSQAVDFAQIVGNVLTAWTGGGPSDPNAHAVFSITLNSDQTYTFQLINPLDHPDPSHATPGPAVEDTLTINLAGLIQAVDFDHDPVTLSGSSTVTITDDVPVATGNLIQNGNFAGGDFSSAFWGGLTTTTDGSHGVDWLVAPSSVATSGNAAQPGFLELERIAPGYLDTFMPDGSFMADLDASPGDIQISQQVHGVITGQAYQLEFWTATSVDVRPIGSAVLEVFWGGQLIETITSTSQTPAPYLITVVGGAGDGSNTLTFAEVGTADFVGTYLGDVALEAGTPFGIVDEGSLTSGTPGDLYGNGNDPGAAAVASGTLAGLVSFGADGPDIVDGVNAGFRFGLTPGAHDFGVSSHGQEVNFFTLSAVTDGPNGQSQTLTAYTGGSANGAEVFTLTLNGDGTYTFTLINPLDHATGLGENGVILDLSAAIQAIDFDGDTIQLATGSFHIDVIDDVPVLVSNSAASATIDEGGLTFSSTGGDLFDNGNDPGFATSVTGTLSGVVSFGADGPAAGGGFSLVDDATATAWLNKLGLMSHDLVEQNGIQFVDVAVVSGNTLQAWTGNGPGDPNAHEVFTLTLNSDGTYTFTLVNPLDDPNPGHGNPAPAVEDSIAIDLSGFVQAVDFDGDAVSLASVSSDFTITVVDDVPVLVSGAVVSGSMDEGALRGLSFVGGTDSWGTGNDSGAVTASGAAGSLKTLVHFGADGPAGTDFKVATHDDALSWLQKLDLTSHGSAVDQVKITIDGVGGSTLTVSTDDGHDVFALTVHPDGSWTFTLLEPIDHTGPTYSGTGLEPTTTLDLSGFVRAVDFDGDAISLASGASPSSNSDFTVTITDDVPTLAASGTEAFTVDEGALVFAPQGSGPKGDFFGNGNDQGSTTASFTGSLSGVVSFGADGPAAGGGFHLVDAATATAWLTSLNLTSHNVAIDLAVIQGNTLQAWTAAGPGPNHPGAHEVFTLTLNSDGSFTFQLVNPIDDPIPGHGTPGSATEDSVTIDLSGLVQAVDFDGDAASLSSGTPSSASGFNVTIVDDVPVLVSGKVVTGGVDEGALTSGNDPHASFSTAGVAGSLTALVSFGADGPAGSDFKFVAHADAVNWLKGLDLTSHGSAVDKVTTVNGVLTAIAEDGHIVFTLTANADGSWSFTLLAPIDHTGQTYSGSGPEPTTTIDLSGFVQAVDFDGDAVTLGSGTFTVTVTDDVPVAVSSSAASATVDEGGLTFSATVGDLFGDGNDHGSATSATVSLSGSVHFGADGPGSTAFEFVDHVTASTWLTGLGLTSHGQAVDFAVVTGNVLTAWTAGGPGDLNAHIVFSVTLNSNETLTFDLINPIDHSTPGHATPGAAVEDSANIDLSGLIQAVDFDGDSVTLSGGATVTVTDDVPVAQGNLIQNGHFGSGDFSSAFWGGLTTTTDGSHGVDWLVAPSAEASPSDQAQPGFLELERIVPGYLGTSMPDGSFMADLDASPDDIQISQQVHGAITGQTYQLEFWTATSVDVRPIGSAVLEVFWGGQLIETITSTSQTPTPYLITVVGGAGDGSNTLTFAEVGTADFVGTYLGDVALEAGTPFGIVDEGGLTTPFVGNDPGTAAVASGSIAGLVSFGADGPAVVAGHPEVVNGFQFVADAQAVLAAMDLSSHGSVIDHLTVTSNGTVLDGSTLTTSTTLEAFAHDGHEAFSLTLDGDGTWQFQLAAPLDNPAPPSGAGEDGTIIDFSQLVSALDYDGDAIPLVSGSFNVDVTDDVPVLTSGQVIAALDEGVLPDTAATASGSLQTLVSFGADGPAAAGFHLVDASTASNWIASLGLSSGGFAIDAATINGSTLTVVDANHDNVFTLTVNGDGAWAFTLLQPIDAPLSGPVTVDLSGLVQATDFDGDTVKLAADFHVDVLGGTAAGDILNGGQGNDLLIGGAGADILHGDLGADFLTGGDGNNVFQYFKPTEGGDTITDFNAFGGQADQIQVSASGFLGGLVANQSVASIFETSNSNAFTNSADRFHFDTANNGLYYSADGTTAHEVLLATVTNHTVTGADIHVAS